MPQILGQLRKPLTRQGYNRLADEHEQLVKQERPQMVEAIATAAAEGDRSENAEYIYGKKRLREIDRRLRYLNHLLTDAQIINPESLSTESICFGCTVTVRDEDGEEKTWTIVGEGESDHHLGHIFWQSPVAKALLGKKVGDIVIAPRPKGPIELEVCAITTKGLTQC